ncbi:unnamed protein product, partial [Rotaria sordida]
MEFNQREELKQDHGIDFSEENEKQSPTLESNLETEANEVQDQSVIEFLKSILSDEEKVIISFENVQQQVSDNDCGLLALTFVTSFCYGSIASLLFYHQMSLCDDYVKCIE